MKLELSSHHLIDLIKEDIKINHLLFGLKDLGLECDAHMPGLSITIFRICGIDIETDLGQMEDYYKSLNRALDHSFEELCCSLDEFAVDLARGLM